MHVLLLKLEGKYTDSPMGAQSRQPEECARQIFAYTHFSPRGKPTFPTSNRSSQHQYLDFTIDTCYIIRGPAADPFPDLGSVGLRLAGRITRRDERVSDLAARIVGTAIDHPSRVARGIPGLPGSPSPLAVIRVAAAYRLAAGCASRVYFRGLHVVYESGLEVVFQLPWIASSHSILPKVAPGRC